jgi:hypothetical protein
VVEVWYVLAPRDTARGNLEIEAAAVDAVDRVERTYWQVILPGSEIVVSRDPRVTPELRWQWDGFGWRRHPSRDQVELEQWIDASRQDPVPPGTNRYLFTAVGAVNRLELATTSRSWILLACSGVTLAVGLLLLYVPLLRHPVLLLAASVVTLTAGMMWPEFAILFAQAAILGALLAVMASVCRRMLWRLYTIAPTVQGRAQFSDSKIKGAEQGPPRADGSSKVSATSAPMSVEIPAAEFKS